MNRFVFYRFSYKSNVNIELEIRSQAHVSMWKNSHVINNQKDYYHLHSPSARNKSNSKSNEKIKTKQRIKHMIWCALVVLLTIEKQQKRRTLCWSTARYGQTAHVCTVEMFKYIYLATVRNHKKRTQTFEHTCFSILIFFFVSLVFSFISCIHFSRDEVRSNMYLFLSRDCVLLRHRTFIGNEMTACAGRTAIVTFIVSITFWIGRICTNM